MIEPSNEVSAAISRRAAERLAGIDAALPAATERLLQGQGAPRRRSLDAGTSLAFASLVVSLAQLGWQLYQDQLRQKAKPEIREVLVRTLRVRVEDSGGFLPPAQLDQVVEVVAEEILG